MARFGRSTIYLTGAGVLLLVAFAAFLIIDLGSRSVDPSSLPVIQLGQPTSATPGETSGRPGPGLQQPDGSSPTTASLLGSATTGSTVRETINGGVHTGTTGRSSGGSPGTSGTSGAGASRATATTGGR